MILLFEGVDNTGKTELAKAVSSKYNAFYFRMNNQIPSLSREDSANMQKYIYQEWYLLYDFIRQSKLKNIVFDRSYISEYAYGYVLRQKTYSHKTDSKIFMIDQLFKELDSHVVYCYKDKDTLFKDYSDKYVTSKKIPLLEKRYENYLSKTLLPTHKINMSSRDIKIELSQLKIGE